MGSIWDPPVPANAPQTVQHSRGGGNGDTPTTFAAYGGIIPDSDLAVVREYPLEPDKARGFLAATRSALGPRFGSFGT